ALVVSGTRSAITKKQIDYLSEDKDIKNIELPFKKIINEEKLWLCIKKDLVTTIKCQLAENHNVVLSIESINNKAVNENFKKVSKKITTRLSDIVKEVIVDKDISLILTGGDTAKAICESIGGKAIKL